MKILAINGSPRKDGNTFHLINMVFEELQNEGIETEFYQLGGKKLHGCTACMKCAVAKNKRCSIEDDEINEVIEKMIAADGIILGSPTYFSNVSTEIKALIDRSGIVALRNDAMFAKKIGAAVVAVRRAGSVPTFDAINHFFLINQMIVPGSCYWNLGMGHQEKNGVLNDAEGVRTMKILGKNIAWLLKKLHQ